MKNLLNEIFKANGIERDEAPLFARELLQKIILNGLSRGQFFKRAAFHGGTALRILYDIGRYSEDLDFSLFEPDPDFNLSRYLSYAENEVRSYGLTVTTKVRDVTAGNIRTEDMRCNMREILFNVGFPEDLVESMHRDAVVKVKIDVNTEPPEGARYDKFAMNDPLNYYLCALDRESMFAGKIGAVIARKWGHRVKGRDLFDYLWYLDNEIGINMEYMRSNLVNQQIIRPDDEFNLDVLRSILRERFDAIDYRSAMDDVKGFVIGQRAPDNWNSDLFKATLGRLKESE
ncbi:MAG: nucleotidyl transferase AbiEii/AbiGii toxin family protein [Candidatus Methanomethylophilaceae archaeon]|nr:nucleotidyl transferase AbiEii/AbiGii toxin family protein [Candidatus Methanomethylophilaceae archaeon]